MIRIATLAAVAALSSAALGCGGDGLPASPASTTGEVSEAGPTVDASVPVDASEEYAVCPPGLDASFPDLLQRVFATASCGTNNPNSCHSKTGATAAGDLLDFTGDAGAVYAALVGRKATNISGDTAVLRVAPFDAGASMLYIKLSLKTLTDPHYGAGMPLTAPGSVCPEALDAVKTWINEGAQR